MGALNHDQNAYVMKTDQARVEVGGGEARVQDSQHDDLSRKARQLPTGVIPMPGD